MTTEKSKIEELKFFISPLKNPYSAVNANDDSLQFQPSVTILLKINGYVLEQLILQELMENKKHTEGSSLLIAIIIMGVLMTLALGVNNLMIGTLRDGRILLEKTRAWYAAESGIERALNEIYSNQPGFETEKKLKLKGKI